MQSNPIVQGPGAVTLATAATPAQSPGDWQLEVEPPVPAIFNGPEWNNPNISAAARKAAKDAQVALIARKNEAAKRAAPLIAKWGGATLTEARANRQANLDKKTANTAKAAHQAQLALKEAKAAKAAKYEAATIKFNNRFKSLWRSDKPLYEALASAKAGGASISELLRIERERDVWAGGSGLDTLNKQAGIYNQRKELAQNLLADTNFGGSATGGASMLADNAFDVPGAAAGVSPLLLLAAGGGVLLLVMMKKKKRKG